MSQREPQQHDEHPGIDPALVRLTLQGLFDLYSELIAQAESGGEVNALVRDYAKECMREIRGIQTVEAETLRAYYRDMLVATGAGATRWR